MTALTVFQTINDIFFKKQLSQNANCEKPPLDSVKMARETNQPLVK
ncbi:protein of unknown function [Shewanella benthica]|uniref:Uncharacterized protein n=1 Tax=Shewanella benthica TaxID=43661 RepID=A0A330M586_9GAMM|nr:protein of unknown function [Shewanella benthica]